MTRPAALFVIVALAVPAAAGERLPVAPPPREVRPDGSRAAAPAEDPAAVVERIIARAKQASDQLAASDAGDTTRATQAGILKDIDALLDPPDSPPKGGGNSNGMNNQDKSDKGNDKSDQKQNDGMGSGQKGQKNDGQGNKGGTDPKAGMNPGGMGQKNDGPGGMEPKDGMNPGGMGLKEGQASGRRPRSGAPKEEKQPGGMAQAGKGTDKQPMPPNQTAKAGTPKGPAGVADKKNDRPPPIQPQLPIADAVAKEVWGHLPERLRLQMTQHYREEFMPRYAGLLRQYYSSLSSNPGGPPAAPR